MPISIVVFSELYDAGPDEEGRPFLGERYHIAAVNTQGRRWVHTAVIDGVQRVLSDSSKEHVTLLDCLTAQKTAKETADNIRDFCDTGGKLNSKDWRETTSFDGPSSKFIYKIMSGNVGHE